MTSTSSTARARLAFLYGCGASVIIVNDNLAAIVLTRDPALRERIRWALTTHHR